MKVEVEDEKIGVGCDRVMVLALRKQGREGRKMNRKGEGRIARTEESAQEKISI